MQQPATGTYKQLQLIEDPLKIFKIGVRKSDSKNPQFWPIPKAFYDDPHHPGTGIRISPGQRGAGMVTLNGMTAPMSGNRNKARPSL